MRCAWGIDQVVGEYISAHFPELTALQVLRPHVAVGFVSNDNKLVGGLALNFDSVFEGTLSIYTDSRHCLTPRILRELFHWAFVERRLARLTCQIAKRNKRARRLVEGLGFKMEGVKRRGFDGRRDAIVYGLVAEDCRWLKPRTRSDSDQSPRSPEPI